MTKNIVEVHLPLPFQKSFTYQVPDGLSLYPGDYVIVPFRKNNIIGVVWKDVSSCQADNMSFTIRLIEKKLPFQPMKREFREFIEWVAHYTMTPIGLILKMAISEKKAFQPQKQICYQLHNKPISYKKTPQRIAVIKYLQTLDYPPTAKEIRDKIGCQQNMLTQMSKAGILGKVEHFIYEKNCQPSFVFALTTLTESQQNAYDFWKKSFAKNFSVSVIDGVTGSGKTEVYFAAIKNCLENNQQILVLLPEIALTGQWIKRFYNAFGVMPCLWHSDLTPKQRAETWHYANSSTAHVIIGARSALFLPFQNLGLIIVDEEHEMVFKQEDQIIYHARDMAVLRAKKEDIPIVLVSATPSLETIVNIEANKYHRLSLPAKYGQAKPPKITTIDLRKNPPEKSKEITSWLSPLLISKIRDNLESNEQTLLFLNRRGYAPLFLCRSCGHRFTCFQCSGWLVHHHLKNTLQCHHCGYSCALPSQCPECKDSDNFFACGPGIERLAEEVHHFFPDAVSFIASSESLNTTTQSQLFVEKMLSKEIDIVIGTQVLAKGYHFPNLTLVGVVDADLGLSGGDLRAAEKTFQLLWQVSGRAGRETLPGKVYLQSWDVDHPVIQALCNKERDSFYETEQFYRQQQNLPPYGKLAALIISSTDEKHLKNYAKKSLKFFPDVQEFQVLGPIPAPLYQLRGKYRYRFLIKCTKHSNIQNFIDKWQKTIPKDNTIKIQIDIDPQSFL